MDAKEAALRKQREQTRIKRMEEIEGKGEKQLKGDNKDKKEREQERKEIRERAEIVVRPVETGILRLMSNSSTPHMVSYE